MSRIIDVWFLQIALVCPLFAAEERGIEEKPDAIGAYYLCPNAADRLKRDKFLITEESFKQVFEPYIDLDEKGTAAFITTDSILAGFHSLFEKTVQRVEERNRLRASRVLHLLWNALRALRKTECGGGELFRPAKRHAEIVLGVALRLLGETKLPGCSEELDERIRREAERVKEGKGLRLPAWLGPPRPEFSLKNIRTGPATRFGRTARQLVRATTARYLGLN